MKTQSIKKEENQKNNNSNNTINTTTETPIKEEVSLASKQLLVKCNMGAIPIRRKEEE